MIGKCAICGAHVEESFIEHYYYKFIGWLIGQKPVLVCDWCENDDIEDLR